MRRSVLETARLTLRPIAEQDAEALHAVYGDPAVMRLIGSGTAPDLAETRTRIARYRALPDYARSGLWAVMLRESGRVIGDCGLFPLDGGPEIELAYRFARHAWGHGYASEAARAWLDYGFSELGLARIVAITAAENLASQNVMAKCGLQAQGTARHYGVDCVRFALDRHDWARSRGAGGPADT